MYPINDFNVKLINETDVEGLFHIEPLPKGYANTLGTVLRRILLSSIPGAAITRVKIDGVQHEYTTVAGLHEDVLSIVLALKQIIVVSHSDEPVTLSIDVKGEKGKSRTVTAKDIQPNALVEIMNPELEITTLANEKTNFSAEITVEKGIGYALPEDRVREEVGAVPIDAIYSPVRLVAIESKNTRVGQQTDLDLLELRIVTNGAVSPSAALHEATQILMTLGDHLAAQTRTLLSDKAVRQVENATLPISDHGQATSTVQEPILVSDMNLSTRLTNALVNSGYEDLRTLEGLTEEEVRNIKGMGDKSFNELLEILANNGIRLI